MATTSLADDPALAAMLELVRELSVARGPQSMLSAYSRRINAIHPIDGYVSLSIRGLEPGEYKVTRVINQPGDFDRMQDPWQRWDALPTHRDGFFADVISDETPRILSHLRVRDDPAVGDALAGYGSCLAVPLFDDGRALNWAIPLRADPEGFEIEDLRQTLITANLVGRATKHMLTLKEAQALNQRLDAQLQEIAEVVQSLLPNRTPEAPGLNIAVSYLPSMIAGGDFYDFIPMSDNRLGVIVGDVSGHGAGAAAVSAMISGIGHAFPGDIAQPHELLRFLNQHMHAKRLSGRFATVWSGVFDPAQRTIIHASAGHHPPRLKRSRDGRVEPLESDSAWPIGVTAEIDPKPSVARLEPGDALVLFTDGVIEARSPEPHREMFGLARLDAALTCCTGEPACVVDTIHAALYEHTRARWGQDDQTIVAVRVEET